MPFVDSSVNLERREIKVIIVRKSCFRQEYDVYLVFWEKMTQFDTFVGHTIGIPQSHSNLYVNFQEVRWVIAVFRLEVLWLDFLDPWWAQQP